MWYRLTGAGEIDFGWKLVIFLEDGLTNSWQHEWDVVLSWVILLNSIVLFDDAGAVDSVLHLYWY